jgi:hypothetical protein
MGAEFLVIFLGVSLSLLADDWRQGRDTHAAERVALEELRADLLADSALLELLVSRVDSTDLSVVWLRRHLADGVQPDSVLWHMRNVGFGNPFQANNITYSGLRASGRLALLQDPEIRQGIARYYELLLPRLDKLSGNLEEQQGQYIDVLFGHALTPLEDSATSNWVREGLDFTSSWDEFRRDPRVEPTVTYVGLVAGNWVGVAQRMINLNSRVRAEIDRYQSG